MSTFQPHRDIQWIACFMGKPGEDISLHLKLGWRISTSITIEVFGQISPLCRIFRRPARGLASFSRYNLRTNDGSTDNARHSSGSHNFRMVVHPVARWAFISNIIVIIFGFEWIGYGGGDGSCAEKQGEEHVGFGDCD